MKYILLFFCLLIAILLSCNKDNCWECELTKITYSVGGLPTDTVITKLIECNQSERTIEFYEQVFTHSPHFIDGKLVQSKCVCKRIKIKMQGVINL